MDCIFTLRYPRKIIPLISLTPPHFCAYDTDYTTTSKPNVANTNSVFIMKLVHLSHFSFFHHLQ